jgi:glutaredoxin
MRLFHPSHPTPKEKTLLLEDQVAENFLCPCMIKERKRMYTLFGEHGAAETDAILRRLMTKRIAPRFVWRRSDKNDSDARTEYERLVGSRAAKTTPLVWPTLVHINMIVDAQQRKYIVLARKNCWFSMRAVEALEKRGIKHEVVWADPSDARSVKDVMDLYSRMTGGKQEFTTWPRIFIQDDSGQPPILVGGCDELTVRLNQ